MTQANIKNSLLSLNFTPHDAEVYLALLNAGMVTAGPLISKTQLHRNIVYTSLDHLVAKKLVSERLVRGKKTFALTTPSGLATEFAEKANVAQELSRNIARKLSNRAQEITIHQGNEEYLNLLIGIIQTMPQGSTKYVIGTGGENFMAITMRPIWNKYHEVAKKQEIKIKMLSYESQRKAIAEDTAKEDIYEIRYLPENIENPAGIHVYPEAETVLNIIYSNQNNPVTAIKIKNSALGQGYLNLFKNLWKIGKK